MAQSGVVSKRDPTGRSAAQKKKTEHAALTAALHADACRAGGAKDSGLGKFVFVAEHEAIPKL